MRVEITVVSGKDKSQAVTDEIIKRFCEAFGGASTYDIMGAWYDTSGKRHDDKSTVIYSYVNNKTYDDVVYLMNEWANYVRFELDELSVLWAVHETDKAFFV